MSCGETNLTCSNKFNVDIGFDYTFNVGVDGEDFTGRTFHFKVKKSKSSATYLFELTNSVDPLVSGVYMPLPATGALTIIIKGFDSTAIEPQNAVYEFYYVVGTGKELMFSGRLEFAAGVL